MKSGRSLLYQAFLEKGIRSCTAAVVSRFISRDPVMPCRFGKFLMLAEATLNSPAISGAETLKREIRSSRSRAPIRYTKARGENPHPRLPVVQAVARVGAGGTNTRRSGSESYRSFPESHAPRLPNRSPFILQAVARGGARGDNQTRIRREETSATFPSRDRGKVCSQCKTRGFGVTSVRREFTAAR
ncbi:hypothetical protein NDU88_003775 [Pleurodeles waltl]|uniref:Uncharacterized protein n=1 Tax=Pleurodeles waltl TaxID=8319 RepID=A0AAV7T622_PLEWA|nr:hypothetical protein NDU88_003775 [Pleurodeles waltl]